MKTTTIESENPELVNEAQEKPPGGHPDPDRPIEGTGGPSDTASGGHTGSNPPPAQTY